ncbi:NAD kinase [Psychroflexus sp. ALD_RP9]|uniref:NAD kinase n=1 Tax=Psychroflexus sp. ALD_RP9 TaxID=2777186 RepID=UPI001A8F2E31|nr:NAD kinase [Psychroflexus sp. ALD_RP9]QSS96228.1 NAD kinase [Psychroflexus sp. ALD_RP9]
MKVGIFGQSYYPETEKYLNQLLSVLKANQTEFYFEENYLKLITNKGFINKTEAYNTFTSLDTTYNYFFSIGGDGTILSAASFVKNLEIPIIGINTGRLGFLATIHDDEIKSSIQEILDGNFKLSKRSLLNIETSNGDQSLKPFNFALNEVAISRKDTTSMITIEVWLNDEYLNAYWSDGIIISTPTGSTGYSLSCGGPIISPQTQSFVITPIAPHNLNARPLLIPDDTEITLKVSGREDNYLISLDSRIETFSKDVSIKLKKANFKIGLVTQNSDSFIATLRKKLLWGEDNRN